MNHFTPIASTLGGILVGIAAAALLVLNGRIAGVSGIVAGALRPKPDEFTWRMLFVLGLVAGGALMTWLLPGSIQPTPRGWMISAAAGVLVGVGSQLGSGCTSAHGTCGIGRFARRSIVATVTFMATGAVTVLLTSHLVGGGR